MQFPSTNLKKKKRKNERDNQKKWGFESIVCYGISMAVLNMQWQIFHIDLSFISSVEYFQVLSLRCSRDTVNWV